MNHIGERNTTTLTEASRIYELWDRYLREGDIPRIADLYAENATLQTPLVPVFRGTGNRKIIGKSAIGEFLKETVVNRPDDKVHWYREGFQWNGKTLFWEYPGETPYGHWQVDLAEVLDLEHGFIINHRIYWGAFSVDNLVGSTINKYKEGRLTAWK